MRLLTPAEEREVRQELKRVKFISNYSDQSRTGLRITITPKNAELWAKVLEMALECNEANQRDWREKY